MVQNFFGKMTETLVLIWEYSAEAIQWIPTWQGLDGFQKSLRPCALDEGSLIIERVNPFMAQDLLEECCLDLFTLENNVGMKC